MKNEGLPIPEPKPSPTVLIQNASQYESVYKKIEKLTDEQIDEMVIKESDALPKWEEPIDVKAHACVGFVARLLGSYR